MSRAMECRGRTTSSFVKSPAECSASGSSASAYIAIMPSQAACRLRLQPRHPPGDQSVLVEQDDLITFVEKP